MTTQGMAGAIARMTRLPALVGLGLLGLAWLGPGPALAGFPGHNGQIAFQSNRDGVSEIYTMNADGGCVARLTETSTFDGGPSWSANGRKIAFQSNRDGNAEIYVMDEDGSNQTRLTNNEAFDAGPAWAPGGRKIVFRSDRDGDPEIYAMNADGSNQTRLTRNPGFEGAPAWSPDGQKIAFASARPEHPTAAEAHDNPQIYVMNADGSEQTRLTYSEADHGAPNWSPDGRRIAFDSSEANDSGSARVKSSNSRLRLPVRGKYDIHAMNADGSGLIRLTDDRRVDGGPSWSPDGLKVAFRSNRERYNEIFVMNADGSEQTRLTDNPSRDRRPNWQALRLPSNRFCLGNPKQNTKKGFVRQQVQVPGPGTAIVRRSDRVRRYVGEVEEAGLVSVLVRPRGAPKRRLDRAGTEERRVEVNVRAEIGFRPTGGRRSTEEVRLELAKVRRLQGGEG